MGSDAAVNAEIPVRNLQARASEAYGAQARASAEERWILGYLPLVKHIVQKVASQLSSREDVEDLISAGTLGLVKAAKGFDPSRDVEFKTYAYIRIRGAVIDELRSRSPVSPKVLKQITVLRQAYGRLVDRLSRPPDDEELAAECGISPEQLYRTLEGARRQHFLCIHGLSEDQPALGKLAPWTSEPSPADHAEREELKQLLTGALMELPPRVRQVLILYYKEDLTMKEIALAMKITESRVSQIHSSALFALSMKLNPDGVSDPPHE